MLRRIIAVIVFAIIFFAATSPPQAHMHDRPDLDQWLRTLYSKYRGPCCDSTEAETAADPDWRNASEMKKDACEVSGGDGSGTETIFCVRLQNPDNEKDWRWWTVPAAAVVELPNRAGPALIWMIWNRRGTPEVQPYIRCFLPGTLS
jgi:hypothetical protein